VYLSLVFVFFQLKVCQKVQEEEMKVLAQYHCLILSEYVQEQLDPNVKAALAEMEKILGTKVRIIEKNPGRGRIEIEYYSADDLDRVYSVIVGPAH
jgi:uncharacterized FlgJ-related protein